MEHWDHVPIYPTTYQERLRFQHVRLISSEDITERIQEQIDDLETDYEYWLQYSQHPPSELEAINLDTMLSTIDE
jgi:hypothetical protein